MKQLDLEKIQTVEDAQKLNPADKSALSMTLNGIGNGMMVGTLPFVAAEIGSKLVPKLMSEVPRPLHMFNAFALVAGSGLGAIYGYREAKELDVFRQARLKVVKRMESRVGELENQVAELKAANENRPASNENKPWADRVTETAASEPGHSR